MLAGKGELLLWKESEGSYLCPEKASQSKLSYTAAAQAKQANEHDYQQDEVANKDRDDGCHIASYVEVPAGGGVWEPRGADLQMYGHK
jgi:hypothetical protein